jgi:hypothetical protein
MKLSIISMLAIFFLIACKKESSVIIAEPKSPEIVNSKVYDSCTYTINGKTFICDVISGEGRANKGANFNLSANTWSIDSIQYSVFFEMTRYSYSETDKKNDGAISIFFIQKYKKSQLIPKIGFLWPITDTAFYQTGFYNYATDYDRINNQNGVAFYVINKTDTSFERLYSYNPTYVGYSTNISDSCQNNSSFEIVKSQILPNGFRALEVKFTANVFTRYEVAKRLTNGYMRFTVIN